MLDDFFVRALVAGVGLAFVTGPLGCFLVWRRMAYFGDTLAHAALLGVALAYLLNTNLMLTVLLLCLAISLILILLEKSKLLATDALLGLLSHSALAVGLVTLAFITWLPLDLMGLLFGDILAVTESDLLLIYLGGSAVLLCLFIIWRPLFAATLSPEIAAAEQQNPALYKFIFMVLIASVVAIAMKIIGLLLITALLLIPAVSARRMAATPEFMAFMAVVCGLGSVLAGLYASLRFDTPSGPSIVVAALAIYLVSSLGALLFNLKESRL